MYIVNNQFFYILCSYYIKMDQKWMIANMLRLKYQNSVEEFIKFADERVNNPNHIKCLCIRCAYIDKLKVEVFKGYLFINEIDQGNIRRI